MNVSVYNGVRDTHGIHCDINVVTERIKSGDKGLKEKTENLNRLYQSNPAQYKIEKLTLPAVTWSGHFPQGGRKADALISHTGYIVLDIDNISDIETAKNNLAAHPNVRFAFVSPSGEHFKALVKVEPIPQSPEQHRYAFDAVLEVFTDYVEQDPIQLPAQRDPNRLCFLAYDPNPINNSSAKSVTWTIPERLENTPTPINNDIVMDSVAQTVLSFINPEEYNQWLEVGMACKDAGVSLSVWELWSQGSSKYEQGACEKKWESFKGTGRGWGSVVRWAEQNGYNPSGKKQKQGFKPPLPKFVSSHELNKTNFKEPEFMIDNLIPPGLSLLAGPPKIGKSFMALNMAMAIASENGIAIGQIDCPTPYTTLYLALEDSPRRIKRRQNIVSADGNMPDNLLWGFAQDFPYPFDETGQDALAQSIEHYDVKCVFIDTWNRMKPMSESKGSAYDLDYRELGSLQAFTERYSVSIVIITHLRKAKDPDNAFNEIQGSVGVQAAVDAMLKLTKDGDNYLLDIIGRDFEPRELALSFEGGLWQIKGEASQVANTSTEDQVYRILNEHGSCTTKELKALFSGSDETLFRALKSLIAKGLAGKIKHGHYQAVEPIIF